MGMGAGGAFSLLLTGAKKNDILCKVFCPFIPAFLEVLLGWVCWIQLELGLSLRECPQIPAQPGQINAK